MNLMSFLTKFSWLDWIGLALFVASWIGYEQVVEHGWFRTKRLREETNKLRLKWAYVMLKRDPRVSDAAMIANLLPSLSFYANTTIYIIAALFAALGAIDQLMSTASDLPFARVLSREAMELKLLILIGVFVISVLKTGLLSMELPVQWQQVLIGVVVILAVLLDVVRTRRLRRS